VISHSVGAEARPELCVRLKSRPHARARSGKTPLRGAEALGSEVFVHGDAEALPWSQAPGVSGQPKPHRAPQESPVTRRELGPQSGLRPLLLSGPTTEAEGRLNGAVRASPRRCLSGHRLPSAEAEWRSACRLDQDPKILSSSTVGRSGFRKGSGQADEGH